MSEAAEKLRAARELIARPGGWTQDAYSRGRNGDPRGKPVCWCAEGAIFEQFDHEDAYHLFYRFIEGLYRTKHNAVVRWNDSPGRTQAEVVDAFTRAIALAEAEGA